MPVASPPNWTFLLVQAACLCWLACSPKPMKIQPQSRAYGDMGQAMGWFADFDAFAGDRAPWW